MKKVMILALFMLLCFQAAAYAEVKIGVVTVQVLLEKSLAAQSLSQELKAKFEPRKLELQREEAEVRKMEENLKKQDLALKLEAKQDMEREFRRRYRDFNESAQIFQQKFNQEKQRLTMPIVKFISEVVQKYGKDHGYTAIYDMFSGGVLYMDSSIDLTDEVLVEVDKAWKAKK